MIPLVAVANGNATKNLGKAKILRAQNRPETAPETPAIDPEVALWPHGPH
jgi:hypothetical protein